MSWGRQLASSLCRNVLSPALSRSRASVQCSALNRPLFPKQFLGRSMSTSTTDDPVLIAIRAFENGSKQLKQLTPAKAWEERSAQLDLPPPADVYAGRRIPVTTDLRSTFLRLSKRLHKNSVYKEWKLSARHEKRGIKRSRLRSERWRKRFADEVRRKVQLVSTIRRRG
ncbi:hypothetical protein ID866_5957 [Astraeus odoratus]|nr:hypothetical protein ID866_5957 [Astraeus odoratus]